MKKDILHKEDIQYLVNEFYTQVKQDDTIGFIFTEVAQVDWALHLPKMYAFWEMILLGSGEYKGNQMAKHQALNEKIPLEEAHFERWLSLFNATVDQYFEGENAEEAKKRAKWIADVVYYKVSVK